MNSQHAMEWKDIVSEMLHTFCLTSHDTLYSVRLRSLVHHMSGALGVPARGSVRAAEDFVKQVTLLSV